MKAFDEIKAIVMARITHHVNLIIHLKTASDEDLSDLFNDLFGIKNDGNIKQLREKFIPELVSKYEMNLSMFRDIYETLRFDNEEACLITLSLFLNGISKMQAQARQTPVDIPAMSAESRKINGQDDREAVIELQDTVAPLLSAQHEKVKSYFRAIVNKAYKQTNRNRVAYDFRIDIVPFEKSVEADITRLAQRGKRARAEGDLELSYKIGEVIKNYRNFQAKADVAYEALIYSKVAALMPLAYLIEEVQLIDKNEAKVAKDKREAKREIQKIDRAYKDSRHNDRKRLGKLSHDIKSLLSQLKRYESMTDEEAPLSVEFQKLAQSYEDDASHILQKDLTSDRLDSGQVELLKADIDSAKASLQLLMKNLSQLSDDIKAATKATKALLDESQAQQEARDTERRERQVRESTEAIERARREHYHFFRQREASTLRHKEAVALAKAAKKEAAIDARVSKVSSDLTNETRSIEDDGKPFTAKRLAALHPKHLRLMLAVFEGSKKIKYDDVVTLITHHLGGEVKEIGNGSSHKRIILGESLSEFWTSHHATHETRVKGTLVRPHGKAHSDGTLSRFNVKELANLFIRAGITQENLHQLLDNHTDNSEELSAKPACTAP